MSGAVESSNRTLTIRVLKFNPNSAISKPHFAEYKLQEAHSMTIFIVLNMIREQYDPDLSFDFVCRAGICGSCGMMINGRPRLACRTLTKDFPDGRTLYACYKDKSISKANYLDQLYKLADDTVANNALNKTLSLLETQKYFNFDVSKQLDKLRDNEAAYIVEPLLLVRKDPEGNKHVLLDCTLKSDDHKVKTYNFDPDKLKLLMEKLDMLNYYCCCMSWLKDSPDSPSIFIFGRDKRSCEELKVQLQNTYGIKRD